MTSNRRTESPDHRRFDASDDAAAVAAAGGDGVVADLDPCKILVGSDAADGGYSASFVAEDCCSGCRYNVCVLYGRGRIDIVRFLSICADTFSNDPCMFRDIRRCCVQYRIYK